MAELAFGSRKGSAPSPSSLTSNSGLGSLLSGGSVTKGDIQNAAVTDSQSVLDGGSPLKTMVQLKILEEYIKELKKHISERALDEASQYEKNDRNVFGIPFVISNTGDKLDYSSDDQWVKMQAEAAQIEMQAAEITSKIKEREEKLKKFVGIAEAVTDDGEVIKGPSISKAGQEFLQVRISK